MKLKTKIFIIFGTALILNASVIIPGLITILDSLSSKMMIKQAENITSFLQHKIIKNHTLSNIRSSKISDVSDFDIAKHIADESKGFELKKIILLKPDFTVEASYPAENLKTDYSTHNDIREAFTKKTGATVIESGKNPDGKEYKDIDVLSHFTLGNGEERVIEVKLDFANSLQLLEAQYTLIESGAVAAAVLLLAGLLSVLLFLIDRTVLKPVANVTTAMEDVGKGNLDIALHEGGKDEFGMLAKRFNEMVTGLKEKFSLYKYVSKGTIDAVKSSISEPGEHKARKTRLAVFFSDIRGFTTFSEQKDPAEVISRLNVILTLQSDIIRKHGGDIDKFVGDEVMAVFNESCDAIDAAIEIQSEMNRNRERFAGLHIGIGIHEGVVMQGDVGSVDTKDYTIIGDNVNTAARLESVSAADEILISENVAEKEDVKKRYNLQAKGELNLKGKAIAIKTYSVKGITT